MNCKWVKIEPALNRIPVLRCPDIVEISDDSQLMVISLSLFLRICKVQSRHGLPILEQSRAPACTPLAMSHPPLKSLPLGLLNVGPRRSQPGQRREPRKIITVSVKEDVHLKRQRMPGSPAKNETAKLRILKTLKLRNFLEKFEVS